MKKLNKKVIATTMGAVFALGAMGSVFAAEAVTPAATPAVSATGTAADTTATAPQAKAFSHKMNRGAKLEALAAEKGITVDELKTQLDAERQEKPSHPKLPMPKPQA